MTVETGMSCEKGHKPRFYMPRGEYPFLYSEGGWKRKCSDYSKGTPKGITAIKVDLDFLHTKTLKS